YGVLIYPIFFIIALQDVYYSWRRVLEGNKDVGTMCILQLFVDMTGFFYTIELADLTLLKEDSQSLLEEKIYKAPFEICDIMDRTFVVNFNKFWHQAIVKQWKELLLENDWFNKSVMFAVVLANSDCDECVMVGSFIGAHLLPNLCSARSHLLNDLEKGSWWRRNQSTSSLQKKQNYIDQICQTLIPDIKHGLQFASVADIIMDQIFETILAFPQLIVLEYGQLDLIGEGLQFKNRKAVSKVLQCLKILMVDAFHSGAKETVALYILRRETQLTCIMDAYKKTESKILHLFLDALGVVGNVLLSEETAEKIVLKMFGTDQAVINAAIDLHGIYCASIHPPAEVETNALAAILEAFERYAYPLASFN
uniref:Uncharacterized protein n=1 Tax=Anopheles minimus TaxID=112268 RepID=A0A182WFH6_9DIPT